MKGKGKKGPKKIKQVWRKKPPPPPPWVDLPRDITANILHRLGAVDILENARKVCTTWRSVCKDPTFWRVIDMCDFDDYGMFYNMDVICRYAVDLSQGQLIDINIEHFCNEKLLEYIAERCSQLRRIRMASCYGLSGDALSRFPLLEELHLFFTSISTKSLEMVGRSCPLLKSFSLNGRRSPYFVVYRDFDEEALTIAKSMPGLRHLEIFGNRLTNKGLQAILDGCRHLELLDLRQCHSLELSGDLGKKCSQQIKCLRLPNDAAADYEFLAHLHNQEFCEFYDLAHGPSFRDDDDDDDYLDYYDDYTRWEDHVEFWDNEEL